MMRFVIAHIGNSVNNGKHTKTTNGRYVPNSNANTMMTGTKSMTFIISFEISIAIVGWASLGSVVGQKRKMEFAFRILK
jgi:hypothetical protein